MGHLNCRACQRRTGQTVALSNAEINDDWISDRDRFAYEGLNSDDRVTEPMIKTNGAWKKVSWDEAIAFAIEGIKAAKNHAGADMLGALAGTQSTTEELYSLKVLCSMVWAVRTSIHSCVIWTVA